MYFVKMQVYERILNQEGFYPIVRKYVMTHRLRIYGKITLQWATNGHFSISTKRGSQFFSLSSVNPVRRN